MVGVGAREQSALPAFVVPDVPAPAVLAAGDGALLACGLIVAALTRVRALGAER